MCVILPVSHIPCTHTVAIWQHCIDATRSSRTGVKPCWNIKQHEKSVLTRRLCEDCSGQRFFARRGGVAERGHGSPTPSPAANDSADDSGYHSDVIHEEDEASDCDECPLSPKALAPRTKPNKQRKRTSSNHHSLTREPSWKPNLKRELDLEYEPISLPRRDSTDSLILTFDATDIAASMDTTRKSPTPSSKTRPDPLFHPPPSSPTNPRPTPSPQNLDAPYSPKQRKNSTLLHPSSPVEESKRRPGIHARRGSSLLHPSLPPEPLAVTQQHRTVLSVPPRKNARMPLLQTSQSEPQSATMAGQRRASVLHSCLSDGEDEREGEAGRERPVLGFGRRSENAGNRRYDEVEEAMMRTARMARESRGGGRARNAY